MFAQTPDIDLNCVLRDVFIACEYAVYQFGFGQDDILVRSENFEQSQLAISQFHTGGFGFQYAAK